MKPLNSGLPRLDALATVESVNLNDYVRGVSEYVLNQKSMDASLAKKAQIALSAGLGRALRDELKARLPRMNPVAGEITVAGALRTARADVSEAHQLDGLRLAVEIKPINVAVGRAMWNRFGDIRAFAVNIHLKFPFAIVGGVLAIPTFEWKEAKVDKGAVVESEEPEDPMSQDEEEEAAAVAQLSTAENRGKVLVKVSTISLIERAVERFHRARAREIEADPAHLLEAVAVIVYEPETGALVDDLPATGLGMRWEEFIGRLVELYALRFE